MLTVKHIRKRIDEIRRVRKDPEVAHDAEDQLHKLVLREIANGHPQPKTIAEVALETTEIDFPRWTG